MIFNISTYNGTNIPTTITIIYIPRPSAVYPQTIVIKYYSK